MDEETSAEGKELIAELCEGIRTGCTTATNKREDQRKCWYTSTCSEYVQKECVGTWRSRSAERGLREWRTNYSSRRSRRIRDYLFKRRRSCSQAQLQEVYQSFFLEVLLKNFHHNGDAFLEDHMGLRWLEQSEEGPLVNQTGHLDDRNSPKCIIGKVQIIKVGRTSVWAALKSNA